VTRTTLVTIAVSGPHDQGTWWRWETDGPGGCQHGHEATEGQAWAAARAAAIGVLGRLEAPLGGHTLAAAIEEAGT
jgi:hypothetical protein